MKSIICNGECCYLCGSTQGLERHHCLYGTANRKQADKYGLTVMLCARCHRDNKFGVHGLNKEADLRLKRVAQITFEAKYSHEKWMHVFGKNYL